MTPAKILYMRILIVSYYFPPYNTIGAVRAGTLAKYLLQKGHDVQVLCPRHIPFDRNLPEDVPPERIHWTGLGDVNAPLRMLGRLRARLRRAAPAPAGEPGQGPVPGGSTGSGGPMRRLARVYRDAVNFPDPQIGWLPYACWTGRRLVDGWRPDLVYSTSPPYTALFIARLLAGRCGAPWIAEYRDRWSEDPYASYAPWRHALGRRVENRLLRRASAIVTVSEPWARDYRERFPLPVRTVMNGFDPERFPAEFDRGESDPERLRIVYTGILYSDRRDPSPLFAALRLMGDKAAGVRVAFYGADPQVLNDLARRHGVESLVETHDRVAYGDSIRLQMQADVLLLLQWNDPRELGNAPGKLFEYIGARRPVLCLGLENGVPARVLAESGAGVVANDPAHIARHIEAWIAEKCSHGRIPLVPIAAREGLSRPDQYGALEALFAEVLEGSTRRAEGASDAGLRPVAPHDRSSS